MFHKWFKNLNPLTQSRIKRFFSLKRASVSLIILCILYGFSLFSEFIANDKPLFIYHNKKIYFPMLKFYPENTFYGTYNTKTDYKKLKKLGVFDKPDTLIIFPPVKWGPNESDLSRVPPAPPSPKHILGTDDRGRDVFTRLLYGFRISMSFGLIITFFVIILAFIIGGVQGYFGGFLDITFQRIIEIIATLPFLYIAIILGATFGTSFALLAAIYIFFNWIGLSYYIRAEYLKIRNQQYILASKSLGQTDFKIMFKHMLPNALTPVVTLIPFEIIAAIYGLSGLDYLGFGLPAPTPSWGEMMKQSMENLSSYWLSFSPFVMLFITLLLISFIGEGIREAVNPVTYSKTE